MPRRSGDPSPKERPAASEPAAELAPRALRQLVRSSPLLTPAVRAYWLRVLPHLTAAQQRELAELLGPEPPADDALA